MHPIFTQTIYYSIVMGLTFLFLGFIMKGFMWKYMKVKLSFGKLCLVKLRGVARDHFATGEVIEGKLLFKQNGEEKRVTIKGKDAFYRVMGTSWIDIDEEKNCVIMPDASAVDGFDAVKYNNLYLRALYSPRIQDNRDKIMLGILIFLAIAIVVIGAILIAQGGQLTAIQNELNAVKSASEQAIQRIPI